MRETKQRLIEAPIKATCEAIVIIPVRNEGDCLEQCLAALMRQQAVSLGEFEVILLLNNCTDDSPLRARNFVTKHPELITHIAEISLPPKQANIGFVRGILMDEACRRFQDINRRDGAILSTDADTQVDSFWILRNLEELKRGADVVGGRIFLNFGQAQKLNRSVRLNYRWETAYSLLISKLEAQLDPSPWDPWPRHHQQFCGSLAISANMYNRIGGLPAAEHLEDIALCKAVLASGGKIRHSVLVKVWTSARLNGRTDVGLSSHLQGFDDTEVPSVENICATARKFYTAAIRKNHITDFKADRSVREAFDMLPPQMNTMSIDVAISELYRVTADRANSVSELKSLLAKQTSANAI